MFIGSSTDGYTLLDFKSYLFCIDPEILSIFCILIFSTMCLVIIQYFFYSLYEVVNK